MARFLILLGLVILAVGLLWPFLSRLGLGRLPGDIVIQRDNFTFYRAPREKIRQNGNGYPISHAYSSTRPAIQSWRQP